MAHTALAQQPGTPPSVRVALVRDAAAITIQGRALLCGLPDTAVDTTAATPLPPITRAIVRTTEAGFLLNEQFFEGNQLTCGSGMGELSINGRPEAGPLAIYRTTHNNALTVVAQIPMERYLVGVLQGELNPAWPVEALRAQTVAARSYALAQQLAKTRGASASIYDLESGVGDQLYRNRSHADPRLAAAVQETRGEVLTTNGQPLKAYFHSCCGGVTEPAANVWGQSAAQGFAAISDEYCARSPHAKWRWTLTRQRLLELLAAAGYPLTAVRDLQAVREAHGDRIGIVTVETNGESIQLSGNQFRQLVGFQELKSTLFKLRERHDAWIFDGRGYGHGAGLCQWGAKGMAEKGKRYQEILSYYYPGTLLTRWY